eukprot:52247_3
MQMSVLTVSGSVFGCGFAAGGLRGVPLGMHDCSPDAYCTNLNGAFTCDCKSGFTGTGRLCTDVDECSRASTGCSPHADCVN